MTPMLPRFLALLALAAGPALPAAAAPAPPALPSPPAARAGTVTTTSGPLPSDGDKDAARFKAQVFSLYQSATHGKNREAQRKLGEIYLQGLGGLPSDPLEAAKWFHMAALGGDPQSQVRLATMYKDGIGVSRDAAEAARWLTQAAKRGDRDGLWGLSTLYAQGLGVPKATEKAVRLAEQAARKGEVQAQLYLGRYYLSGQRVADAARAFRAAADQGDVEGQYQAILLYTSGALFGSGYGRINYAEGLRWVEKLARRGNPMAQAGLGLVAENQRKDKLSAYAWYALAAGQGHPEAKLRLTALKEQMSPGEVLQAERLAASWWNPTPH